LSPEKKQFKSNEVESPEVVYLSHFLTYQPPAAPPEKVDDVDDDGSTDDGPTDVWDDSWVRDATLDERQKSRHPARFDLYSIAEEWERQRLLDRPVKNDNCLCCRLCCDLCSSTGINSIAIPNSQYEYRLRHSTDWYRSDFIAGFAALVKHDAHITTPKYKSSDRVLMVFTPFPNKPVTEILPYGSMTHFVSVVWNRHHYAVLYYDIDECSVTVFDGLNMDIRKWQDHIIHTVKTYGLKPLLSSASCEFRYDVSVDEHIRKRTKLETRDMVLDITFDDSKKPWQVKNNQSYVQGDGVSCGPIACLKVMEIYSFLPVGSIETIGGESGRGYRHVVMDYYKDCVSRHDNVLKVAIATKNYEQAKQSGIAKDEVNVLAEENSSLPDETPRDIANTVSLNVVHGTGLNFGPKCDNFCFTRKTVCEHIKKNVPINNLGDYVVFPSNCFHQGYFNSDSEMIYVTAQLFARPTIAPVLIDGLVTRSLTKDLNFIQGNLNDKMVVALSNDIFQNWDTTYSLEHFGPCKNFDGPVDKDSNRQIPHTKFHEAPLLKKLVDTFTEMLQYLTIDMVWLIVKSKPGSGFQSWHQDFNLNEKITKTIVINLGAVKRSDLLGGPLRGVIISENKDNNTKVSTSDVVGGKLCGFINSGSKDNEGNVSVETERRDDAMAKKNRKQESQAIKAMKQCGRAAQAAGAGVGAVVSLKVDYRTHSHAQGLLAIVYEMKQSTGGILVCCEHGVITHDGSRKDY